MRSNPKGFAVTATGASTPQGATSAGHAEGGEPGAADRAGQPVGAGCGAGDVVNSEIINSEPARNELACWWGFDPVDVAALD